MTARILVVDDVAMNVALLEAKLSAEYYEVLKAWDGAQALEIASEQLPDLILLDVMMPGMDGFEVAKRLRAGARTRHIPIIMVTALSEVADRVRGLEAGADDFLTKPVNDVALIARIRSLLRLKLMMDELRVRRAATHEADGEEAEADVSGEGGRILLVEGQAGACAGVEEMLTEAGHQVVQESDAETALSRARNGDLDTIIIGMSAADGSDLRLCSRFRSQEETRQVPILGLLADDHEAKLAKSLEIGATDYIIRPIDRNELVARTRTQIRRRRYHEQLRGLLEQSVALAYTDELTGLYNRRFLVTHLGREILELVHAPHPVSLVIFDIDHFKRVNDTFGHVSGDAVLKRIAEAVSHNVRTTDLVARYGGEEFVIIMPKTAGKIAHLVADRLRIRIAGLSIPLDDGKPEIKITVSMGLATCIDPSERAEALLERADAALYRAKRGGRNRVIADDPPSPKAAGGTMR
ncbi:MAG: PleD family two-component system response regulator [Kiloniellales bacterium]